MTLKDALLLLSIISLMVCIANASEDVIDPKKIDQNNIDVQIRSAATLNEVLALLKKVHARLLVLESQKAGQLRGRDGRDGLQGKPGKDGRDGRHGDEGLQGPKGNPGKAGLNGKRGPPGPAAGGVQYVRWGRTTCPSGTSLLYKGRIGGGYYNHLGGGSNYVCLTEKPKFLKFKSGAQSQSIMYGTEYETNGAHFAKKLHDHEAVCAVCYVPTRSAKLMIPGTYECLAGWKREYQGYLMSSHHGHRHATTFICVDKDPEAVPGSQANHNGALLYTVEGLCGALPCPPYVMGLELTCAVCTK